ncbi:MAG: type II toxin-antitoxin system PemK/MazF family toxin [Deltaproteobacteria bacterium]|nr:type II toxin-antitoxin system PemK/MazF family toxin [Deltaproteobacteria bacterium]
MKRGEVRWYKFAKPDKKRPVLILTRDSILDYLGEVTVAPVTTTVRDIPSEVALSKHDGMSRYCAVNCDHIQTVSRGKIGSRVTTLSNEKMSHIAKAIVFALNLRGTRGCRESEGDVADYLLPGLLAPSAIRTPPD